MPVFDCAAEWTLDIFIFFTEVRTPPLPIMEPAIDVRTLVNLGAEVTRPFSRAVELSRVTVRLGGPYEEDYCFSAVNACALTGANRFYRPIGFILF